jgi:quercetin dioxygenase-like cupin family protein
MSRVVPNSDLPRLVTAEAGDNRSRIDLVSKSLFGTTEVLAYKVTYHPGDSVREHFHGDAKHFLFSLEGSGVMHSTEGDVVVGPGDVATIEVGERHAFSNPHDEDWTFIELCMPMPTETVWSDPDYTPEWLPKR